MPEDAEWVANVGGSSVRLRIDMGCDERKEKRREDAHKWECPQDLLPKLCQFAVIDSLRSGVRDFCGRTDGARQEWRVSVSSL